MSGCFKILSNDSNGSCYNVDTTIGEGCFTISTDIPTDNVMPEGPLDEFVIEGFISIRSVCSHGLFRLLVLGIYKPTPISEELEVLAVVDYIPSVSGGVGQIGTVQETVLLEDIGIIYSEAGSIEAYDITSSVSRIHIHVGGSNVVWLDPVSLLPIADTRTHADIGVGNYANSFPYLEEDTFGHLYTENSSIFPHTYTDGTPSFYPDKPIQWRLKKGLESNCSFIDTCGGEDLKECYNDGDSGYHVPIDGNVSYVYMQGRNQSNGNIVNTSVGAKTSVMMPTPVPSCTSEGTFSEVIGSVITIRRGVIVCGNGDVYFHNIEAQSHTIGRTLIEKYTPHYDGPAFSYYSYKVLGWVNTGLFIGEASIKITGMDFFYGLTISMDNQYFIAYNDQGSWGYKRDGSKSGNLGTAYGFNTTMINGVILTPAGDTIHQTFIDDLI